MAPTGLRKCGADLGKILTAIYGTQRQKWWQKTREAGRLDPTRFAIMLADERAGRG